MSLALPLPCPLLRSSFNKAPIRVRSLSVAIDLIAKHIHRMLEERGFHFRSELATIDGRTGIPASVHVMPPTPQRKVMHTMIRDKAASRDDFIFYSQRLFRLLIEEGLSVLPFEDCDVVTPTGATYHGVRQANDVRSWRRTPAVSPRPRSKFGVDRSSRAFRPRRLSASRSCARA